MTPQAVDYSRRVPRRANTTHIDDPVAVGRRISDARVAKGASQRGLAFPGCTAAYISRIERGERIPSVQVLRELARRLDVSESFLARGVEDEDGNQPFVDAELALRLDDHEHAREMFERLLEDAANDRERARALAGLGQIAFAAGEVDETIELLGRALELRPDEPDPSVVESLGRAYAMANEFESAIALFETSLRRAEERNDQLLQVRFAVLLANALIDSANFTRAEEILARVLVAAGEWADPIARARILWSQSRLHALQNDAAAAAKYARRALDTLEATDHSYYAARAHQLVAHIELDRGNAVEALALLERGLPLVQASGSRFEEAIFRLDEARARLQLGQRDEAASLAMATVDVLRDASPLDAGRSFGLMAEAFAELGEPARAIELYELAIEFLERSPTRYLIEVYGQLADLLEREGRKDEALELLKRGMRVQSKVGRLIGPR